MERFDVIVVGGRCAGSPLAAFLARAGLRVCVIDRSRFPSDVPSTHGIQPCGVKVLDRLGVTSRLLEIAPPIESAVVAFGPTRLTLEGATSSFGAPMINIRRISLDVILLEAAAVAGAEVRTGEAVTGLVFEDGRVAGVRTATGAEIRAPLVVGADGPRSVVARMVGAREYLVTAPGRTFVWAYFAGVSQEGHVRLANLTITLTWPALPMEGSTWPPSGSHPTCGPPGPTSSRATCPLLASGRSWPTC